MTKLKFPEEKKYYVYEWYIIKTGEVFYVGKGCRDRWKTRKRENHYFMKMLENHDCDVRKIAEGLSEQEAFELEIARIKFYRENTDFRLTNILDGGEQPPVMRGDSSPTKRPDVRERISSALSNLYSREPYRRKTVSQRMKLFYSSDEGKQTAQKRSQTVMSDPIIKEKIKQSNLRFWDDPKKKDEKSKIMKAAYASPEVRAKITGKNNGASRTIKQYDLDGKYLATYETLIEAEAKTGISYKSISKALRGHRKTAGGFMWQFADGKTITYSKRRPYKVKPERNRRKVAQYSLDGNLIAVYESLEDATVKNDFHTHTNISANLSGRTKSAYGFVWRYYNQP